MHPAARLAVYVVEVPLAGAQLAEATRAEDLAAVA